MLTEHEPLPLAPGDRCGRYTVDRVVGRGGMGVVYLARDDHGAKRALKTLVFGGKLKASVVERFRREILLLASIEHVHVVRFFDAGRLERPGGTTMWFALEYLEGKTLRQVIEARPQGVEPENVARWGRHIADGVGAAHRIHVVHRDLKPENAALHGDIVKVFDLGIAKWKGALNTTAGHVRIGTLLYMAPEQVDPMVGEVDARTDIYALGLVLYELATGRHPLIPLDGSISSDEAQMRLLVGDIPLIRTSHPSFPPDLEAIILRCLRHEPDARWSSMREVSDALEDVLLRLRTERHAASFADLGVVEGGAAPASIVRRAKTASGHDVTPPPAAGTSDSGLTVRMSSDELLGPGPLPTAPQHPSGATPAPFVQTPSSPAPKRRGPRLWLATMLVLASAASGAGLVAARKHLAAPADSTAEAPPPPTDVGKSPIETPHVDEPALDEQQPAFDEQQPALDEQQPAFDEQEPRSDDEGPRSDESEQTETKRSQDGDEDLKPANASPTRPTPPSPPAPTTAPRPRPRPVPRPRPKPRPAWKDVHL